MHGYSHRSIIPTSRGWRQFASASARCSPTRHQPRIATRLLHYLEQAETTLVSLGSKSGQCVYLRGCLASRMVTMADLREWRVMRHVHVVFYWHTHSPILAHSCLSCQKWGHWPIHGVLIPRLWPTTSMPWIG